MDLAALDGGGHTEGVADRFAERLRAIDDEQPRQCRIEPPGEEIVEQGLDDDSVLRRPLDHGQDMLVAVAIDADRRHQDMVADMQTVDLDDQQVELREVRGEPGLHLLARQRHKAPGNGRLRGAVATRFRQVALGQTDRAVVLAGRHVQDHQVERPLEQQVAVAQHLPALQTHLLASMVANPWPLHFHAAAVVADLALRMACGSHKSYLPQKS